MRIVAAVLSLVLGVGLAATWATMQYQDAKDAPANLTRGFSEINAGSSSAFRADMDDARAHQQEELVYGLAGAVFVIAGFALFPYKRPVGPAAA